MSVDTGEAYDAGNDDSQLLGKRLRDFVIAYVSCPQDSGRNYLGGVLLTDYRTHPLEFAFVSPVKVSAIQRIIHGKTLDEAITVDLVAKRLLDETTKRPDIIFVDSDLLLELQRVITAPIARLYREENTTSQANVLSTVRFVTARGSERDGDVGSVLGTLEHTADLVEPFSRIAEAIRESLKSVPPPQTKP